MPRLTTLLRWLRAPLAATAACDSVACLLLALGAGAGARPADPPPTDLARATAWPDALGWLALAGTSLLIYGFGMGLNDWADRERDRTLAPTRPLPSGELHAGSALGIVLLLGAAALWLGGGPHGSRGAVGAALACAAAYNLLLKRWLVPGACAMGAVRACNASIGVVLLLGSGSAFTPQAPAWVLLGPLCVGLYAAAVSVLSTTEEVDSPARRVAARLLAALAFGGGAAVALLAAGRLTLGAVFAAGTVSSLVFARVPRAGPAKRQVLEMLLGLYVLAAILAGGVGAFTIEIGAVAAAFLLVYASQIAIRALAGAAARGS